jgi:hypothetical protein
MKIALLILSLSVMKVSCGQKTVFDVMDNDTTLFNVKHVDGSEEVFLKDTNFKDGVYIVHSFGDKKIIRMRFGIKRGKPCGEMIKYHWNGKILYKKDYGTCN